MTHSFAFYLVIFHFRSLLNSLLRFTRSPIDNRPGSLSLKSVLRLLFLTIFVVGSFRCTLRTRDNRWMCRIRRPVESTSFNSFVLLRWLTTIRLAVVVFRSLSFRSSKQYFSSFVHFHPPPSSSLCLFVRKRFSTFLFFCIHLAIDRPYVWKMTISPNEFDSINHKTFSLPVVFSFVASLLVSVPPQPPRTMLSIKL